MHHYTWRAPALPGCWAITRGAHCIAVALALQVLEARGEREAGRVAYADACRHSVLHEEDRSYAQMASRAAWPTMHSSETALGSIRREVSSIRREVSIIAASATEARLLMALVRMDRAHTRGYPAK